MLRLVQFLFAVKFQLDLIIWQFIDDLCFRTNLMKLRADYKDAFVDKHGVKLGLMSGFIKVVLCTL